MEHFVSAKSLFISKRYDITNVSINAPRFSFL